MKSQERLWLRLGDCSDYAEFGQDLDCVAGILVEAGVSLPLHARYGGFCAEGYEGANYVSLYWGNEEGNLLRNLTTEEMDQVTCCMRDEQG